MARAMKNYRFDSASPYAVVLLAFAILAAATTAIAQTPPAKLPASLRLYVFDGGSLNIPDTSPYQLKKEELASSVMFGTVLPGGAPPRHPDVGCVRGARQQL